MENYAYYTQKKPPGKARRENYTKKILNSYKVIFYKGEGAVFLVN